MTKTQPVDMLQPPGNNHVAITMFLYQELSHQYYEIFCGQYQKIAWLSGQTQAKDIK